MEKVKFIQSEPMNEQVKPEQFNFTHLDTDLKPLEDEYEPGHIEMMKQYSEFLLEARGNHRIARRKMDRLHGAKKQLIIGSYKKK